MNITFLVNKKIHWLVIALTMIFCLSIVQNVFAGVADGQTCDPLKSNVCNAGSSCDNVSKTCKKDTFGLNPVNTGVGGTLGNKDLRTVIGNIINVALSLLGVVAVVIILIGGFKWMTAGGSEDKVEEAKKMIFQGIIGLAIILSAWAIAIFVLNSLASATSSGSVPTF